MASGLWPRCVREFRFSDKRRWRFDFAVPKIFLAVEIEGGTWANGRHNRGKGYEADCEKYAEAMIRGWRVFRFTTKMILDGRARSMIRRWKEANG